MSLFDQFSLKTKPPKGHSAVKIEFTEEESEAINLSLKMHAAIANEDAPEGMVACVAEKFKNALIAQALTQYVEDLMSNLPRCSGDDGAVLMDKGIKAQ